MIDKNIELVHDSNLNIQYIPEYVRRNPGPELVLIK